MSHISIQVKAAVLAGAEERPSYKRAMRTDEAGPETTPSEDERTPSDIRRKGVRSMRERDARGRKTMQALHEALIDLIKEQPLERITVDAIVERANIGRATFYRHYATKE